MFFLWHILIFRKFSGNFKFLSKFKGKLHDNIYIYLFQMEHGLKDSKRIGTSFVGESLKN